MMAQFTLVQSYSDAHQDELTEHFRKRLRSIVANGHLALAIALGRELNLFDALARAGNSNEPASALEVARLANCKKRYVHEWLCCMACGEIISVTASGMEFWIPENRVHLLIGPEPEEFIIFCGMMPDLGAVLKKVGAVFKVNGPMGIDYHTYSDFYGKMNVITKTMHKKHLINDLVPLFQIYGQLNTGIEVLDVGCGTGFHVLEMAEHFPNTCFTGIDIGVEAIRHAQHHAKERGIQNATFVLADAMEMDASWANKFDLITIFDACHDQERPDLALKEVHRCLKFDGLFVMVETDGTGNCHADKVKFGSDLATYLYAISLFHSLPVGSNSEDALQLGSMWGVEKGRALLEAVPFKNISIEKVPYNEYEVLYKAHK